MSAYDIYLKRRNGRDDAFEEVVISAEDFAAGKFGALKAVKLEKIPGYEHLDDKETIALTESLKQERLRPKGLPATGGVGPELELAAARIGLPENKRLARLKQINKHGTVVLETSEETKTRLDKDAAEEIESRKEKTLTNPKSVVAKPSPVPSASRPVENRHPTHPLPENEAVKNT